MNRILALASFAFAFALAAAGCGSTCNHACDQQQKCPGAVTIACGFQCNGFEHDADHADCRSQFETWQTCVDMPTGGDYCADQPDTRCSTEHDAYAACVNAFCATHAGDELCVPVGR